jgi:hypothetical protein
MPPWRSWYVCTNVAVVDEVVTGLDRLAETDVTRLSDTELREQVLSLLTVSDRAQAELCRRIDAFERRNLAIGDGFRTTKAWLQAFGRLSGALAGFAGRAEKLGYASLWSSWYMSGGQQGEEPPEPARQQMQLYDQIKSSADPEEQARLMRDLLDITKDQFYVIGVARETEKYFIAANHFRNVPDIIIEGWTRVTPGPTRPEQYFLTP